MRLKDLDDKAMWTMRTTVILLGILASAAGIAGEAAVTNLSTGASVSFGLGIIGLFLTLFVGVGTLLINCGTGKRTTRTRQRYTASHFRKGREWLGKGRTGHIFATPDDPTMASDVVPESMGSYRQWR